MCTAVSFKNKYTYFGRNLDLERGYNEKVVITPRNYEIKMRCVKSVKQHYAMIGMAAVVDDFPLYFEATNEKGLSIAGLNFPDNAVYCEYSDEKDCITPFELIPYVLAKCTCITDVKALLSNVQLVNINFNEDLPLSPLHWMISDKECSITLESVAEGLKIYDNPFEILTNNPPFDYHQTNINNYMSLHAGCAASQFGSSFGLHNYSLGMGALGLPGDFSSASRFVRAFFVKENSVSEKDEKSDVNQFFHILNSVSMPKGCVWTKNGFEYTRYTSCCNAHKGIYYYTTYENPEITAINMYKTDINKEQLCVYEI